MFKQCYICDSTKTMSDFYKNQTRCKSCTKEYNIKNKEKIKKYKKEYRENNKEFLKEKDRVYYLNNKDRINAINSIYYENNKDKIREIQLEYREKNKESLTIKSREVAKRYREKRKNDPLYNLTKSIRSLVRFSLQNKGYPKKSKTEEILGCTFEEFKAHLESKFEIWMTWENKGLYNGELKYGWDIDHIVPLSIAKTEEEIIKLNHYTNLQPLCGYTNRYIKMSKLTF